MIARSVRLALQSALIAAAGASSSCAPIEANHSPDKIAVAEMRTAKLAVLNHDELRRLLIGSTLNYPARPPILWREFSVFDEGGRYLHVGHRNVSTAGSYVINSDWVCVRLPQQADSCFLLGRNERGEYFSKELRKDAGPPTLVEVHRSR